MPPLIRVEHVGKSYKIRSGLGEHEYQTLRESLVRAIRAPLRRGGGGPPVTKFWALEDVSFAVRPGEVVGILGKNGSGKSTLLKILSRITRPTRGRVELRGRVGSLLEVGTGFHPELTGRENVFLNGSILGMRRAEIARRFDEIAAFAEVERFLDTPVKRYSSGMYVRLAFAVASHLEPEILLVDEVLAVGDAAYQAKCAQRMGELAASGRTILLVSHNMDLIPKLCSRAVLLHDGKVDDDGPADQVVERHLGKQLAGLDAGPLLNFRRPGDARASFTAVRLVNPAGRAAAVHLSGDDLVAEVEVESAEDLPAAELSLTVVSRSGTRILTSWTRELGRAVAIRPGLQTYACRIEAARLRPGHSFHLSVWLGSEGEMINLVENALAFQVLPREADRHLATDAQQGVVLCDSAWEPRATAPAAAARAGTP